ncbi:MAG: restriction endonuclease subunit S [Acidobacteriota bacterium]|nr:restriction endonuclease subunit S [Acidobacteriota bacterium]
MIAELKTTSRENWRTVRFGDVVRNVDSSVKNPLEQGIERFVGLEHLDPESLHVKRWGNVADGTSFTRKFESGQVLFGKRRAYQRKAAVADFDGICSGDILVFEPKTDELLPELLPFVVQSDGFFEHALGTSAGSLSPRTKWSDMARYEFVLPPKDEQRRIAEILWSVDKVISSYEKCISETMIFQKLFMESRISVESSFEQWKTVSLNEVCFVQSGQVNPKIEPYSNMIHIAPDDIESQTGRILEKKTASEDKVISGKYEFKAGVILYNKIRPNLQKVAMPDFNGICSADVYPVYAKESIISKLLFYILLSDEFTKYATANSVRSAIPKLNREALMKYSFKLPSMDKQEKIVEALDAIAFSLNEIEKHKAQSQNLKNDLIRKLLFKTQ